MVTTTYGSSRDSLHHSLMRPQTLANSQMASNSCGSLLTSNKNQQGGLGNGNGNQNNCSIAANNCSLNSTLIPNKGSEFYCWQQPYLLQQHGLCNCTRCNIWFLAKTHSISRFSSRIINKKANSRTLSAKVPNLNFCNFWELHKLWYTSQWKTIVHFHYWLKT